MNGRKPLKGKTFLIFHYRAGLTDGVSLEIAVWKVILENLGATVKLVAGPGSVNADFEVKYFNYCDNPRIRAIDEWAFGRNPKLFKNEAEWLEEFNDCKKSLSGDFEKIIKKTKPDWVIVSNVFSLGENLPATVALAETLKRTKIRALLVHHDFYWEHGRCNQPISPLIRNILDKYYPPQSNYLEHSCINSLARDELYRRKGTRAMIISDSVDFHRPLQDRGAKCTKLLEHFGIKPNDLIILQATRIAPRKAIEIAIDFVKELSKPENLKILRDRGLYNQKGFDPSRDKIVLLMAGYNEKSDQKYKERLLAYAKTTKINFCFLDGRAGGFTPIDRGPEDKPTLLDLYIYADLITYPSLREGFGNQFLEAILSKTPVVLFEYPVFRADIKPKGFKYVSLGKSFKTDSKGLTKISPKKLRTAVAEAVEILTNPKSYQQIVDTNFELGTKNYSIENISKIFEWIFSSDWLVRKLGYHQHGKVFPSVLRLISQRVE